ncbi:MAG: acetylglutamate kinase [Anaerolinea sp.]|nr:acetylglutamate kinase [Anaerolinea sp.]
MDASATYPITVIKISGHEIDDTTTLTRLAAIVAEYPQRVIVVHGGGKEISALQTALGIEPRYIDGQRVTDAATLSLVEMVLCGVVNKRLVRVLLRAGVDALGISGVDRQLITARKLEIPDADLGFTGVPVSVNQAILLDYTAHGIVPVIAPVCYGAEHNFNVNADLVAGAIAASVRASQLIFLSNVPGVLDSQGELLPQLTAAEAQVLIAAGTIHGGMLPKVRTALDALRATGTQTVITDLDGLAREAGTRFVI